MMMLMPVSVYSGDQPRAEDDQHCRYGQFEPIGQPFLMRGIGYGGDWRHGGLKGELVVGREDIDLAAVDMGATENFHIQAISKCRYSAPGEESREGVGVFEQLIFGPYRPYGI